jgi:hypothetical protein
MAAETKFLMSVAHSQPWWERCDGAFPLCPCSQSWVFLTEFPCEACSGNSRKNDCLWTQLMLPPFLSVGDWDLWSKERWGSCVHTGAVRSHHSQASPLTTSLSIIFQEMIMWMWGSGKDCDDSHKLLTHVLSLPLQPTVWSCCQGER